MPLPLFWLLRGAFWGEGKDYLFISLENLGRIGEGEIGGWGWEGRGLIFFFVKNWGRRGKGGHFSIIGGLGPDI